MTEKTVWQHGTTQNQKETQFRSESLRRPFAVVNAHYCAARFLEYCPCSSTEEIFLRDFLLILKQMLQN